MPKPLLTPSAVIFDWDETLAQTRDLVVTSIQRTLDHYKLGSWNKVKNDKRNASLSLKENFPNIFGVHAEEAYGLYLRAYKENLSQGLLATAMASETVNYLQNLGIKLFILSNKEKELLEEEVNYLFSAVLFNRILGNGDAEHNKPHPASVYAALSGTGINTVKDHVWLVGDSKQDTDCALSAGCLPILIGQGKFIGEDYWTGDPEAKRIHTFQDFGAFLECIKMNPSIKSR
jgi:phosphoglycolate phosphatase